MFRELHIAFSTYLTPCRFVLPPDHFSVSVCYFFAFADSRMEKNIG